MGEQTAEPEGSAPDALRTAYEHHYAQLVRLCGLLSGSREVAEDIVQTVFVRAASRIAVLPAEEVPTVPADRRRERVEEPTTKVGA